LSSFNLFKACDKNVLGYTDKNIVTSYYLSNTIIMASTKHPLSGKIALVTGATRGIGKGIALQLAEAGAFVYVTGRTLKPKEEGAGGSLAETTEEMKARGLGVGGGEGVLCDHAKDEDVTKLFEKIKSEQNGRLDILINNAFAGVNAISSQMGVPFWEQKPSTWDDINGVGLRNHYLCTVLAAQMMVPRKSGLILTVSSVGGLRYLFNVPYGVGKEAKDRMMKDCSIELKKKGVTCISLWPGAVRTEQVMYNIEHGGFQAGQSHGGIDATKMRQMFENGESTEFSGKCVVALATDPSLMKKTGRVLSNGDLASEYGLYDANGSQPMSIRSVKSGLLLLGGAFGVIANFIPAWVKIPCWIMHLAGNKF